MHASRRVYLSLVIIQIEYVPQLHNAQTIISIPNAYLQRQTSSYLAIKANEPHHATTPALSWQADRERKLLKKLPSDGRTRPSDRCGQVGVAGDNDRTDVKSIPLSRSLPLLASPRLNDRFHCHATSADRAIHFANQPSIRSSHCSALAGCYNCLPRPSSLPRKMHYEYSERKY